MADITWTMVTDHAAGLTATSANAQTTILAWVNDEALNPTTFGGEAAEKYKLARIYLAAHYGTVSSPLSSASGAAKKKKVGDLEIEYASFSPPGSDPLLDTTQWGKAYRSLVRTTVARVPFIV